MTDFRIVYHYSPVERRDSIYAHGLRLPGTDNSGVVSGGSGCVQDCRPVVCTSPDPETAWALSGGLDWPELRPVWDLWQIYLLPDAEVFERELWGRTAEVRLFESVPAVRTKYIGTRTR